MMSVILVKCKTVFILVNAKVVLTKDSSFVGDSPVICSRCVVLISVAAIE